MYVVARVDIASLAIAIGLDPFDTRFAHVATSHSKNAYLVQVLRMEVLLEIGCSVIALTDP